MNAVPCSLLFTVVGRASCYKGSVPSWFRGVDICPWQVLEDEHHTSLVLYNHYEVKLY